MVDLRRVILDRHIRSIAIPPLGCGLGGPAWEQVRPVIAGALGDLGVDIRVYEPLALRAVTGLLTRIIREPRRVSSDQPSQEDVDQTDAPIASVARRR